MYTNMYTNMYVNTYKVLKILAQIVQKPEQ